MANPTEKRALASPKSPVITEQADDEERRDSFVGEDDQSSAGVLAALRKAEDAFRNWHTTCSIIDDIYSRSGYGPSGRRSADDGYTWQDSALDLFWASFEILKPAVYARPPQPVVTPMFKDSKRLTNLTAEMLERAAVSIFKRTDMNEVMLSVRDDLIFAGRGAMWLRYEDEDGQRVCVEHKDRLDFLHEPTRKWSEVGWVGAASWLTKPQMKKRFHAHSGDAYLDAKFEQVDTEGPGEESRARTRKCKVWEVWHKADKKVYWVTDGVDEFLDQDDPHLDLTGFFPCPRPAFATLARRSLIPVPDYERYSLHFDKISELTGRIYLLLNSVKMKGLIPAGGDVGDAIEQLMSGDDDNILIPVPGAAMLAQGATGFVMWLPLAEVATAITGLITARSQLIDDFYQLSGVSDIMRGATEADETLGAQQLKSQYGSVRVREKSMELQRVAADAVCIAAEIAADKFTVKTFLDMTQMEIPTKAEIEKRVKEVEKAAEEELKGLAKQAEEAVTKAQQGQEQVDPAQAQQMFQQAQQAALAKYAPMLAETEAQVPIDAVMSLLRDGRARNFTFEIESSSTVLMDEMAEKASRSEFMGQFTTSSQAMMGLAAMGEPGAKLAGALMKFALAPYRVGRELDGIIDEFIDAAPEMAAAAKGDQGDSEALAEANKTLAAAEQLKAQAAMASVQSRSELAQAENQRKMVEMQQKAAASEAKFQGDMEKLRQSGQDSDAKLEKTLAEVDHLRAQTAELLSKVGLDVRKQELAEYSVETQQQDKQIDRQTQADNAAVDREFRERGESRADQQAFAGGEPE